MHLSLLSAVLLGFASARAEDDLTPHGRYVEARTASVFAGACHYGSEVTTQGREALLAWHFDGGQSRGVDLAGVDVVVAIAGARNLAEARSAGDERRALVYVSQAASPAQAEAAIGLLRERHAAWLGRIEPVQRVPLGIAFSGENYTVDAPGRFALHGAALPDRACCTMPHEVWYRPFENAEAPRVGHNTLFRFDDKALGNVWSRADENSGFTGSFRYKSAVAGTAR